jgi:dipeptidyl aminopeptidase/acylaminoacyl peptidase
MDAAAGEQRPTRIPTPGDGAAPASHLERITVPAEDGTQIGAWLVVPPEASAVAPAPLVLFIHGGPLNSWSGWHWRWNPHLLAAAGYAVVLPDPGLSTGYGIAMTRRGWGRWGAEPYTDLMAVTDAVVARNDIDGERTVAMGGSFGGYMANWIAGHTDRFRAIVTHASLWDLEAFHGTTDFGVWWEQEFGDAYTHPERYREWSPHRFVDRIRTPMLVVHGELDYRVPIGEALALWTDLRRHGVPSRFLYFPDENHWVLKPQHARLWYETVLAFLDEHVRDGEWRRPELL